MHAPTIGKQNRRPAIKKEAQVVRYSGSGSEYYQHDWEYRNESAPKEEQDQ